MPVVDDEDEDVNALLPVTNIQQSLAVLVQVYPLHIVTLILTVPSI